MIKQILKPLIPDWIMRRRMKYRAGKVHADFARKTAAETFSQIYAEKFWGGEHDDFNSGSGSTEAFAQQYGELISKFIAEHGVRSVVDIGCGDFRVASKIISDEIDYVGIDVVQALIERNQREFGAEKVRFCFMDASETEPPDADLCLIRQVLQHLSNAEISNVLQNCRKYRYVIITEHYPAPDRMRTPNIDIPHGPGMRVYHDSAVVLDKPPFDVPNVLLLSEVEDPDGTRLKTMLVENPEI